MSAYPLISWRVTVPAFTVTVDDGLASEVLNVPAGEYWGWRTTGAGVSVPFVTVPFGVSQSAPGHAATTDSLAGVLAATLLTHTGISATAAHYLQDGRVAVFAGGGGLFVAITATSNAAALALFGLTAPVTLAALDIPLSVNLPVSYARRTAGVWRPAVPGTIIEPRLVIQGTGAWSPYDPSAHDRVRVARNRTYATQWPFVAAADISREYQRQADYLAIASRATGDTLGTFDDLIDAAAADRRLALQWLNADAPTDPVRLAECIMPVSGALDVGDYITEEGAGQRLYRVSLALLEAGVAVL